MDIGVVFPQTDIGNDPHGIRDYAQAVEALGYTHTLVFDHVLGANRERHRDLTGPYGHRDAFHEPFVLFGYLAAVTRRLGLATGIVILPSGRPRSSPSKRRPSTSSREGGFAWEWRRLEPRRV